MTAVKCKDVEAEHAINVIVPDGPRRAWPWSQLRDQTITTITITRSDLLAASRHPDGFVSVRDSMSLQQERYRSGLCQKMGFGNNDDNPIIAIRLRDRQEYQLGFFKVSTSKLSIFTYLCCHFD